MISQFDENVKKILGALALGGASVLSGVKHGELMSRGYKSPQQSIEQKIETSERPKTSVKVRPNISQKAETPVKVRPNISQDISSPEARARHAFYKLMLSGLTRTAAIGIVANFNTQIDFIIHELTVHPEYMRVKQMLNNADSVEDATLIFLKKYEKAGVPHTGKRLRYAKELEQTMDQ